MLAWLVRHDAELALSTVVVGEIAFGIEKIRFDERSVRLTAGITSWRERFADRIFPFTEAAALAYGALMGAALRGGRPMGLADGMIAAISVVNNGQLATRDVADFSTTGLRIVSPWNA